MRIAVDARAAARDGAGPGRYLRELLDAIDERGHRHEVVRCVRSGEVRAAARAGGCDVLLAGHSYLPACVARVPVVQLVHDLVTLHPELGPRRRSVLAENPVRGRALRRAAAVITVSETTAAELRGVAPETADRVTVVLPAVPRALALATAQEPFGIPGGGFVLAVGTIEPRKNLGRLAAAYERLPATLRETHPLVVAGAEGWRTRESVNALRALRGACRRLGPVTDAELAELYGRCTLLCYPSLGEGFGLPVLEAMHFGAAVVTSDRSSLPEVAGGAAELVDPTDAGAIAAGLAHVLGDPAHRHELERRGLERAASFDWARSADRALAVLEGAAG